MLIEFRVENHRSLADEQVLSMEAANVGEPNDTRPRRVAGHVHALLPVAALYGANASGKSNVLSALAFMRDAVFSSHRFWGPDEKIPRDPFAWGSKKSEPSLFEVTLLLKGVRFQYGFVASDHELLEEWLYVWPKGHKQTWFERDKKEFKFGEHLKGENKLIESVTRPNALFLSTAVQHQHRQLCPLFAWFESMRSKNVISSCGMIPPLPKERALARLFEAPFLSRFRALLKNSDVGISDVEMLAERHEGQSIESRIRVKHRTAYVDSWLPLREESHGTQTLFSLAYPVLHALASGSLFVFDELERSLHPAMVQKIVHLFNDPKTNPANAQLVFTTHDTNLLGRTLGEPDLRRDQVWLTEKNDTGETVLYPLTDFKPRKAENVERGYLQGRYGAIPFLGDFAAAGA